MKSYIQSQI